MKDVLAILKRQEQAVAHRTQWETIWQEIAERCLPRSATFVTRNFLEGEKRTQKLFDSTAALALHRFAAAMESMLTPRAKRWHKLVARDRNLMKSLRVKRYLDEVTEILFAMRYAPGTNFASQFYEHYENLGGFGTGSVFIDESRGNTRSPLMYRALHLSESFIFTNAVGMVDTHHRPFQYTARQAYQYFGSAAVSEKIRKCVEGNHDPDKIFEFLHVVAPNEEFYPGRLDRSGMRFASCYIDIDSKTIVEEGGFHTFPYAVSRYLTTAREVYGRSPAMDAMPAILTLNEQKKTVLRAGQKAVDPPLLLQDDGALAAFDLRAGALNYGTLNMQGTELVKPLMTGARVDIGLDLMQDERKAINDHFLVSLFQILVEAPQMTATEAMLRAQEKGALLAPTMGRQQSEALGPTIERELDICARRGMLPDMPDELIETGGEVDIIYDSPLSQAQKAGDGVGILTTFTQIAPFVDSRPDILDKIDFDVCLDVLADVNGMPTKCLTDEDKLAAIRKARDQKAQMGDVLTAAPIAADAAKNLAQAQVIAGSAPPIPMPA